MSTIPRAPKLADRVALVFGAGSSGPGWGNGKATAVAYAREGATVVCVDIAAAAAAETAGIIRDEGGTAHAHQADVTKSDDVARVVADVDAELGRIDILHNNVGIGEPGGPVDASEESWRRVMDVNLTSMFLTCKHVLPVMERQRRGVIVNVSSVAAIRYPGYPAISYPTSKAAVNHFTRCVALEYARRGIRAVAIMPGLMNTPMIREPMARLFGDLDEAIRRRDAMCPTGKMGDAWDVANAAVFLASDDARYITGTCLVVDGGLSATAVVAGG